MRWTSTPSPEHAEAVSRRMATLSAELAAVRRGRGAVDDPTAPPTQLRVAPPVQPDESPAPAPVPVPQPGRHASRRARAGRWSGRTPRAGASGSRSPRGLALGSAHLALLALVVGVVLAATAWLVLADRAQPEPLPEVAPAAGALVPSAPVDDGEGLGSTGAATGAATGEQSGEQAELVVDVAGKVRRPGIVELPPGSRVVDALEAAGGPRRGVELASLNLARPVVDGEQILVAVPAPGGVGAAATPGTLSGTAPDPAAGALVNLNTADLTTLETLPGVGPVTAQAILDWRSEHGGFTAVEELLEVDGIGDATMSDLAPLVTI